MHNARFDLAVLGWLDQPPPVDDTMLLAALLGEDRIGLKVLDERYHGGLIQDRIGQMLAELREERLWRHYHGWFLEELAVVVAARAGARIRKKDLTAIRSLIGALAGSGTDDGLGVSGRLGRRHGLRERYGMPAEPDVGDIPADRLRPYSAADAAVTMREYQRQQTLPGWAEALAVYRRLEEPLFPVLGQMEQTGICVDTEALAGVDVQLAVKAVMLKDRLRARLSTELDPSVPAELRVMLYELAELPVQRRTAKTRQPSTARPTLEALALEWPWVADVIEMKHLDKLRGTYTQALPAQLSPDGRLRARFHQLRADRLDETSGEAATATGRLSSSDPNLQNIPVRDESGRLIRTAFVPGPGLRWFSADYASIELVILAHLAQDLVFLATFNADPPGDPHLDTAKAALGGRWDQLSATEQVFWRGVFKNVNYLIPYGGGPRKLVETSRYSVSLSQAEEAIQRYFEAHRAVRDYQLAQIGLAQRLGYTETLLGRRRYVPEVASWDAQTRAAGERAAFNLPVTGTAADLMKLALRRAWELLPAGTLLNVVHDELDGESSLPARQLHGILEEAMVMYPTPLLGLDAPIRVSIGIGKSWGEAKA